MYNLDPSDPNLDVISSNLSRILLLTCHILFIVVPVSPFKLSGLFTDFLSIYPHTYFIYYFVATQKILVENE